MKTKNILLSLIIFTALFFGANGCNNNPVNSSNINYPAMVEQDFQNSNLQARPGSVLVVELEDLNSPPDSVFDTDEIGTDAIPIKYTETAEHSFRLDESSAFEMKLVKAGTKEEIFMISSANPYISLSIPAGDYVLVFKSHRPYGTSETGDQLIFMQPDKSAIGNTDYDEEQLKQFISTHKCDECNLSNADLSHKWLYNVSLVGANLNGARFDFTEFDKSTLAGASIQNAIFRFSVFDSTDFSHMNLKGSAIISTRFQRVNFAGSDFSNASLKGSTFSFVNFNNANFTDAELSNAVFDYTIQMLEVNMTHTNLIGANFSNIDISRANFSNSNLTSATFNTVNARGTNFCGALKERINARMVFTDDDTQCWP